MAGGAGAVLLLALRRSAQSGNKTLAGAYATIFEESAAAPWLFSNSWIDFTNMQAGDTVWIKVSAKGMSGGAYVVEAENSFRGVQPAWGKAIRLDALPNVYGVRVEAYQSTGAPPFLSIDTEFMLAKR